MRALCIAIAALWLTAFVALNPRSAPARAQAPRALLVVVGEATGLSDISLADLRSAFLGEFVQYAAGKRLLPFNHATGTPARETFDRKVLGLEPSEVGRFWITRRIRDEGLPPRTLPSKDLALRVVASLPGAITYVDADTPTAGVRVLTVDGKSPRHPGYLLTP